MNDKSSFDIEQLATKLKQSLGIIQKQDIQVVSQALNLQTNNQIKVGDDCAAIPDGDGYLLLAAEGIWHVLVETDPWFAGWYAVMVNVSDIAAMGGTAIAIADTGNKLMLNQIKTLLSNAQLRQQMKNAATMAEAIALIKNAGSTKEYQFFSNRLLKMILTDLESLGEEDLLAKVLRSTR